MSITQQLKNTINQALGNLGIAEVAFTLEHPTDLSHGDYATNVALVAAKQAGKNPKELADQIVAEIQKASSPLLQGEGLGVRSAGPGFINFTLSKKFFVEAIPSIAYSETLSTIVERVGSAGTGVRTFGLSQMYSGKKVLV